MNTKSNADPISNSITNTNSLFQSHRLSYHPYKPVEMNAITVMPHNT